MSNRLGTIATLGILGLGTLGIYAAPLATADTDCRYAGFRICAPGNEQGVTPGWYGDSDCWPGAIYCPDIDGPYDPAKIHPGMLKPHTWDEDGIDHGPSWDDGSGHLSPARSTSFKSCDDDCEDEHDYYDVGHHGGGGHSHHGHGTAASEDKALNHHV